MSDKRASLLQSVFSVDNALVRACERVLDLVVLNLLFLVSCLPLVTIGIARMSLYETVCDLKRYKRLAVISSYVGAFKKHIRLGFKLGVVELVISSVCLLDLILVSMLILPGARLIQIGSVAVLLLLAAIDSYVYPMAVRFEMSVKDLLTKGLLLAGIYAHWTFLLLGIWLVLGMILYASTLSFLLGVSLLLLLGFSSLTYGQVMILEPILQKYIS